MSTMQPTERPVRPSRTSPLVAWGLLAGGALFFVGGAMHPKEDPPDATVKEHMRLMFEDDAWYPSHAVLLVGMVLIAAALVALARGRTLSPLPRAQTVAVIAAVTAALGALGALLHLVAASEADRIATHQSTPIVDVHVVVETLTVPAFGLSIAALAVIGASTRTLGGRLAATLAVVGGLGYALAGGTFWFTDQLNFLFPAASGIGLWAIATGIGFLLRFRTTSAAALPTA